MGRPRFLARPLSWFLKKLGARDAAAAQALRQSFVGSKPPPRTSPLLEDADDLLWTRR